MDEGPFRMDKEHIGHPYFLHQAAIKGHAFVCGACKGKSFIFPVVPQVQSHGEVLREWRKGDSVRNKLKKTLIY